MTEQRNAKTVLVVEDHSLLNKLLSLELKHLGFDLVSVFNGKQALAELQNSHIDYIVTDLFMPEMDGKSLVKELRGQGYSVPVIVVSASDMQAVKEQMAQYEPIAFIDKPLTDIKMRLLHHYLTSWLR